MFWNVFKLLLFGIFDLIIAIILLLLCNFIFLKLFNNKYNNNFKNYNLIFFIIANIISTMILFPFIIKYLNNILLYLVVIISFKVFKYNKIKKFVNNKRESL